MTSLAIPTAVHSGAQRDADAFGALTGAPGVKVAADQILTGRATMLGLTPRGGVSAGAASRLMRSRDGWWVLTLSRRDDVDAISALLEADTVGTDPWPSVRRWAADRDAADVTERARLLGLPVAELGETVAAPPQRASVAPPRASRNLSDLLVADLSAMWAGPLCGQLPARASACVVKVESRRRPDGTRSGPAPFFDWMNSGKLSYAADFDEPSGLLSLLSAADVVIESSRPSALARRRLHPADAAPRAGRVWLRITGHGTEGDRQEWVAFGDDATPAAGLGADNDTVERLVAERLMAPC